MAAEIAELQKQGFALPDYPEAPGTDEERDVKTRYDSIKGSAVNPVLREGNSDLPPSRSVKLTWGARGYRVQNLPKGGGWSISDIDSLRVAVQMGRLISLLLIGSPIECSLSIFIVGWLQDQIINSAVSKQ